MKTKLYNFSKVQTTVSVLIISLLLSQFGLLFFNSEKVYAAPIDDARTNACKLGVVDKKECETWFDKGYKEAKRIKNTDPKKVCIAPKNPSPVESARLKGCYEGVNFYRAEQQLSVPGGSDIKDGTVKDAAKIAACKDETNQNYVNPCEVGYQAGLNNKTEKEACGTYKATKTKAACVRGYNKGKKRAAPDGAAGAGIDQPNCSSEAALGWIVCPLVEFMANFSDYALTKIIAPLMENVPINTSRTGKYSGSFQAWQNFRLLANIVLVGSLLIVVYSQVRGEK